MRRRPALALALFPVLSALWLAAGAGGDPARPRLRDLGVEPGVLPPGPRNAITDVAGVRVGHRTLIEGETVRTGVTAILPHDGDLYREKVPAAVVVGNGYGKAAGFLQVEELGEIETPIVLTNTLAVGTAVEAVVAWTLEREGHEEVRSVNAVVGETNDGYLNDIRSMPVTGEHVREAIRAAAESPAEAPVAEGSVGAGTGTRAFDWKGGIGTASRVLPQGAGGWTVGVLVQTNFGGLLTVDGVPVAERMESATYRDIAGVLAAGSGAGPDPGPDSGEGSCMIVIATDAPLSPRNLRRLASRALLGMGRTGSVMGNGSGDFVIAFSTAQRIPGSGESATYTAEQLHNSAMSPLFLAVVEATEEAIYNSLTRAETVEGHLGTVEAIPIEALRVVLAGE
jgi:D-aminopeptidase